MFTQKELDKTLKDWRSRQYADIKNRLAYIYITASMPSHLRPFYIDCLEFMCGLELQPKSLDGRPGRLQVPPGVVEKMGLRDHPMVLKFGEMTAQGWSRAEREPTERRSFAKIYMLRGDERVTIKIDGAVKDGWR